MKKDNDLIVVVGLVTILVILSIAASLRDDAVAGPAAGVVDAGSGSAPPSGPVTVVRIKDVSGATGKESEGSPSGAEPEVSDAVELDELQPEEIHSLKLDEYDIILPGGLVLPRPGRELVPNPPVGMAELVVHDNDGRLFYSVDDGSWSTIWYVADGKKHSLWTGRTDEYRVELAAVAAGELWVVLTSEIPFTSRRQAWEHASDFQGIRIEKPDAKLYPVTVGKELVETVLKLSPKK